MHREAIYWILWDKAIPSFTAHIQKPGPYRALESKIFKNFDVKIDVFIPYNFYTQAIFKILYDPYSKIAVTEKWFAILKRA